MPTTAYVEILSLQKPFDIGTDDNNRSMFSSNYIARAGAPVNQWELDIYRLLNAAGLATLASQSGGVWTGDTFIGRAAVFPPGNGPYIHLINTGGTAPLETHDGNKYERPSVQIIVRAKDRSLAEARAFAIWNALDGVRDTTVAA